MGLDLGRAAADIAQAARAVGGAELADDVFCGIAEGRVLGEGYGFFDYSVFLGGYLLGGVGENEEGE